MASVATGAVTDITEYLVDAQEQSRLYPDTFWAPDEAKLASAKPGDFMKICDNEQRFWTIVVSADATHITAKVDNATGREDRGYGANQLITYERRHAYIHHTPKEQAQDTIRNKLMMGLMSLPTRKQVELRRMNSYVPKRWLKEPDLFEQGASSVEQALAMPADHNKILKHFRTYPKLLKAAGLKADDIGISHVHSRKEIAANMFAMGEERDDAKVDRMYHVLHNLAVHDKLACEAFND